MAALPTLFIVVLAAHVYALHAYSPTPAPEPALHVDSPPPASPPAPSVPSPSPSHGGVSDRSPPSPTPQKSGASASPTPAPDADVVNDVSHADVEETSGHAGGGMSGGRKAGIALGVIAGACVVGIGAVVYKKRQQNIRRSRYGYAAESEMV